VATIIAITSDEHCGSSVGLMSPKGVYHDDGQWTGPSKGQTWLWDCWRRTWDMVAELQSKYSADVFWINNGDLVDGPLHHSTYQTSAITRAMEREVVRDVLDVPLGLNLRRLFFVRGTESHVGKGAAQEEGIAKALSDDWPVEPETDRRFSWWHLMMECEDVFLDCTHHGRSGQRPWTQWNATALLAAQITLERVKSGERLPDLAIRSHYHRYADSYDAQPVRVIQTPAFQLATSYVTKVVPESLADIGGIAIVVDGDQYEVHKQLFIPSRGRVCKKSANVSARFSQMAVWKSPASSAPALTAYSPPYPLTAWSPKTKLLRLGKPCVI